MPLRLPTEVTLVEPVRIPIVISGTNAGSATLQRGMRVKLISVQDDLAKIQYQQTITTIPRKSTDLPAIETP